MGKYEVLMHERWAEFLLCKAIVGGDIYFTEGKHQYVGRIKKVQDNGGSVIFYLEWCAYKLERGWVRRNRTYVSRKKVRLEFVSPQDPVVFGEDRILLKGQKLFNEHTILEPQTPAERKQERLAKARAAELPLFETN